jgi:hypothetical protein
MLNVVNHFKVMSLAMHAMSQPFALVLRPRQRLTRVRAKREAWESHFMLLGMQKIVRE